MPIRPAAPPARHPRPVVGVSLLTISAAHLALGAVAHCRTFAAMAADGLVGSLDPAPGAPESAARRGNAFWFETTGVALLLLGGLTDRLERQGHPLPPGLGWGLGATALLGGAVVPVSGVWTLLVPAAVVLTRSRTTRPRESSGGDRRGRGRRAQQYRRRADGGAMGRRRSGRTP
ncbi:hypothetical protein DQ238_15315 [Geodermatophilus sp. TF02-6]|uniref:DUF6463 family protein n=1 Tax=Geodermatophilus sp. TF02-6 TaxID=2250575 RepID=UPI000DE885E6|nr:DUF6463 family protein [Geodermatophilus sp. TF02-6]RBY77261.1 hypothetical protein DQ238_15315 [Geodermatophilus sp. TF02-6]